jgi:CubicO group peptidase (beta-lactamase class C family)
MNRSTFRPSTLAALLGLFLAGLPLAARNQAPASDEIRKILVDRIDAQHQGVGMVVGVVDSKGRRIISYGSPAKDGAKALDGQTVFEIGSVTKVFTSLLLTDMVQRGEVALADPVAKYLPDGVKVPQKNGKAITLLDLSNQVSGLPRLPGNLAPKDLANPYADYSVEQLYQFLSTYELPREIGSQYEYSNLGVGLLGQALARRAGVSFEELVRNRIGAPLAMKSTGIRLTKGMERRFAVGHDETLAPVANWDLPALAGAGALRSNADDLLSFLAAHLGLAKTKLGPAMTAMLTQRKPTGMTGLEIAIGWHVSTREGTEVFWHNGGTGGFRSFIGFNATTRVGVVVLSNTATAAGVDDIGMHLLDPGVPLLTPPKARKEVALDPNRLEGLPGRYQLTPSFFLTITREGDGLFAQATGQPKAQIFPESERAFFFKVVDAQITFKVDSTGKATSLVLHQGGRDTPAKRVAGEAPPAPEARKEIKIDSKLLDQYVGRYVLAADFFLAITREGDRLFAQATNQPKIELFAESSRDFFFKAVDAQITFDIGFSDKAPGLTLHQNGAHMSAKRVD